MPQKSKTIIFGGAFDPPHLEHKKIVENAIAEMNVDKIILTPSYQPPHKSLSTPFDHRVAMLRDMFSDNDKVIVDEIEKDTDGKNYTAIMLPKLSSKYGEFTYLMGGDSLLMLDKWYNYKQIMNYPLAVVARGRNKSSVLTRVAEYKTKFNADITTLDYCGLYVSSGYIRAALEMMQLQKIKGLLSERNIEYITKNQLYTQRRELITRLFSQLSDRLTEHTVNTVLCACELNTDLGLPYEKVFLSALLHDVAKERDCGKYNIPQASVGTSVQHQFLGAILAEAEYGIVDVDILRAIQRHTTSSPDATKLDKLIYCADMLEVNRNFDGVEDLRTLACEDFEKCYRECIKRSYRFLQKKNVDIYPLTTETYHKILLEEVK